MDIVIHANQSEQIRQNLRRYSGFVKAGGYKVNLIVDVENNAINPLQSLVKLKTQAQAGIAGVDDVELEGAIAALEDAEWNEIEQDETSIEGVFDKLSKGLSHPAVTGVLTALNTIPGVAAYTAPAYAAAQAVAAVGSDLEKKPPKKRSKEERAALASRLAAETNAQLRKKGVPIVVSEKDIARAIVARTMPPKGGLRALVAMAKPKKLGSEDHLDALALLFAGRASSGESTEFTSIPVENEPAPMEEEDSGVAGAEIEIE